MTGAESRPTVLGPALAALATLLVMGAIAWGVIHSDDGPVPPFLGGPKPESAASVTPAPRYGLQLAGSGSSIPITASLAAALPDNGRPRPFVHPSIGSRGGLRALLDGAIDLALVSRSLSPTERELGLVETPYARVPIVVAVNESVPDEELSVADLVAIYRGERTTWADDSPITVLQREPGDSSHKVVSVKVPAFAEANEAAWAEAKYRVLYHDDDMRDALAATKGAIGLFGQGGIPPGMPIKALRIEGVSPTLDAIADGAYPFTKDLSFVSAGPPAGAAADFVAFAHSAAGRELVRAYGALPIGGNGAALR